MAENFHSGVCGENWWTSLRNAPFAGGASPCSVAVNDAGLYGWAVDMVSNIKARSFRSGEENIDGSLSDGSMIFDNTHKALPRNATCQSRSELAADPAVDMMGFGQSSQPVPQWNQALLEKLDQSNYSSILQGEVSSTIQKEDWSSRSFSDGIVDASMINGFKQISPRQLSMDQSELTCVTTSSSVCTATTCEGFSTGFPIGTGLSGSSCGFPLMQSILDETPNFQSQHQSILNDRTTVSNLASALNPSNRSPPSFSKLSSPLKPLSVNHQPNQFQLSNIAVGSSPISSLDWTVPSPPTLFDQKPSCFTLNPKRDGKDTREMESAAKKSCAEPTFKRPRIETPSPLPTFKVRKEKLGDRITALQQLVSPFGKTDTASVLHEAIVYIKILHDQLHALSIPYLRNNNGASTQHGQGCNSMRDSEGPKQDLRSRGLCLVPISSTFPVAHEAPFEFWTPAAFGATFR